VNDKYLVKNPWGIRILKLIDLFLISKNNSETLYEPKRLLLSNIAHLGDVVIATSILPQLKEAFPQLEIGFLIQNAAKPILEGHPFIKSLHILDHWKLNRDSISMLRKIVNYRRSFYKALHEIKAEQYDTCIDLYPYFPNSIPLLSKAKIPVRIGYSSGGFGPLLTHPMQWKWTRQHVSEDHLALLSLLPSFKTNGMPLRPHLNIAEEETLPDNLKDFIVFHTGPPESKKSWTKEYWRELTKKILHKGYTIVFTGKGASENAFIQEISAGLPHTINLCNRLGWKQWAYLIQKSRLLISVDSAAAHIASAQHLPTIVLFCNANAIEQWKPLNPYCFVFDQKVRCVPCTVAEKAFYFLEAKIIPKINEPLVTQEV